MSKEALEAIAQYAPRVRNVARVASGVLIALGYHSEGEAIAEVADPVNGDLAQMIGGLILWIITEVFYERARQTGGAT